MPLAVYDMWYNEYMELKGYKLAADTARGKGKWNGANSWIRKEKRISLYLRDGMACAYCGMGVEDGVTLSLDHIVAHSNGGTNHETNLVTCCGKCNSSRGNRDIEAFAEGVAAYINHGTTGTDIMAHIEACRNRPLKPFMAQAKEVIARRRAAGASDAE